MKKWIALILLLMLAGCTVVSREYNITQINGYNPGAEGVEGVTINGKVYPPGNYNSIELLLEADVDTKTDATNTPDISPSLSIPLP